MIIRDCYEQLYARKFQNIKEMDKFLHIYILPRFSYKEIENLSRPIISNDIKSAINCQPSCTRSFTAEFYQTFKEEIILILLK
jgi:hypothetical protein